MEDKEESKALPSSRKRKRLTCEDSGSDTDDGEEIDDNLSPNRIKAFYDKYTSHLKYMSKLSFLQQRR